MGLFDFVGDILGIGGDDGGGAQAAEATVQASNVAAEAQGQELAYLKEADAIPRTGREEAIQRMMGIQALPGGVGSEQQEIDRIMQSPLYQAMLGGREAGEESIMRNASMTGGFRSGNVQENFYDYNTQLQNNALLTSYNSRMGQLQNLMGMPSMAPMIGQTIGDIGMTRAQGISGAGQARAQADQGGMNNLMGLAGLGIGAYGAGMFSDRRLKKEIKKIGRYMGQDIYSFSWNRIAEILGLTGKTVGVMADEVMARRPDAVSIKDCFLYVNYEKLGILPETLSEVA